jgi:hypothetical protein
MLTERTARSGLTGMVRSALLHRLPRREGFGSTSLVEGGSNYFLEPNGGSAVELSYGGAPVVAGQFDQVGGPGAPIGTEADGEWV